MEKMPSASNSPMTPRRRQSRISNIVQNIQHQDEQIQQQSSRAGTTTTTGNPLLDKFRHQLSVASMVQRFERDRDTSSDRARTRAGSSPGSPGREAGHVVSEGLKKWPPVGAVVKQVKQEKSNSANSSRSSSPMSTASSKANKEGIETKGGKATSRQPVNQGTSKTSGGRPSVISSSKTSGSSRRSLSGSVQQQTNKGLRSDGPTAKRSVTAPTVGQLLNILKFYPESCLYKRPF